MDLSENRLPPNLMVYTPKFHGLYHVFLFDKPIEINMSIEFPLINTWVNNDRYTGYFRYPIEIAV